MKRVAIPFVVLLSGLAAAQSAETTPSFQLSDVRVSPKTTGADMRGGYIHGGRFELKNATMLDLLVTAYGLQPRTVLGGPSWLNTERYDIIAAAPTETTQSTARLMLQSLLADRFKLVSHKDSRPLSVFVLSAGKGKPKMKESDGKAPIGCNGRAESDGAATIQIRDCHNMTMAQLAGNLPGMANNYVSDQVIDETGLSGAWDFELRWHGMGQLTAAGSGAITLFAAIDKELGLKLEKQDRSQPVLVVDSVNRNPTENEPGVSLRIPPSPVAEFEVATIKPSAPDSPENFRIQSGLLNLSGVPLKELIQLAWEIDNNLLIADVPKFAEKARFSITAKAPVTVTGDGKEQVPDDESLILMLRALLVDRFKLQTHTEDRPVEGYVLTAQKPKLQKADPADRTECKQGPGKDGKDPRIATPVLNRLYTCTNMTMAQFAESIPHFGGNNIQTSALDSTGLEGAWEFTVSFSTYNLIQTSGQEPNGALSFADAVSKQLGLKLELKKRPMPVLVIDHVNENPTEN